MREQAEEFEISHFDMRRFSAVCDLSLNNFFYGLMEFDHFFFHFKLITFLQATIFICF